MIVKGARRANISRDLQRKCQAPSGCVLGTAGASLPTTLGVPLSFYGWRIVWSGAAPASALASPTCRRLFRERHQLRLQPLRDFLRDRRRRPGSSGCLPGATY